MNTVNPHAFQAYLNTSPDKRSSSKGRPMSTKLEFRQMDQLIDPNYDPYKNQKKTKN